MKKTIKFIDSSSNVLNFDVYFRCDYREYLKNDFTESVKYKTKNTFEVVYTNGNSFIGIFFENPLGFKTFVRTNDIKLMQLISNNKFIFFNPNDNFDEIHFFEILTKEDVCKFDDVKKEIIKSDKYTEFYKLEDGRTFIKFSDKTGQLFYDENELGLYESMINDF